MICQWRADQLFAEAEGSDEVSDEAGSRKINQYFLFKTLVFFFFFEKSYSILRKRLAHIHHHLLRELYNTR